MYILIDIGGTKTRVAKTTDLQTFEEPIVFATASSYREEMSNIKEAIHALRANHKLNAIAGGIRGPLNHEKNCIVSEIRLTDWVGRNIVSDFEYEFSAPTFLENDTALAGLGETLFGAGKGYHITAYHTISTGVGGARYVQGALDVASIGFEPGHQSLDIDRSILGNAVAPTLENLVSGSALHRRKGKSPRDIPDNDPVWRELAGYLGHGLKNTIVYWSPDCIVLGGSMILGSPRIQLEDIREATTSALQGLMPTPPIVEAKLGDFSGLYGAMCLLNQKFYSH